MMYLMAMLSYVKPYDKRAVKNTLYERNNFRQYT